ncbi:hypothetical protein J437_LFUL011981 [Ladona fulva]|uniref:Uncharacterized protein n=1 Tax=Ladona fulva TaxID=123851 RepID=A0A8K0P8L8_LADFU|nr:hypothetical protein J437_LFUL011981 [Ladona fulva]
MLIEVWNKGMIWDRALGYHLLPLDVVQYSNEEGVGQWLSLEAELVMEDGEVVGTKGSTGHSLLVDCRFELPFGESHISMALEGRAEQLCASLASLNDPAIARGKVAKDLSRDFHSGVRNVNLELDRP